MVNPKEKLVHLKNKVKWIVFNIIGQAVLPKKKESLDKRISGVQERARHLNAVYINRNICIILY